MSVLYQSVDWLGLLSLKWTIMSWAGC